MLCDFESEDEIANMNLMAYSGRYESDGESNAEE